MWVVELPRNVISIEIGDQNMATIFTETFNSSTTGALPAGWVGTGVGAIQAGSEAGLPTDYNGGSGKAIRLTTGTSTTPQTAYYSSAQDDGSGNQRATVYFRNHATPGMGRLRLYTRATVPPNDTCYAFYIALNSTLSACVVRLYRYSGGTTAEQSGTVNLAAVWPAATWFKITGESTSAGLLTMKVQRLDNNQWLTSSGTWNATEQAVVSWTVSTPITGAGYCGLEMTRNSASDIHYCDQLTYENLDPPVTPGTISITSGPSKTAVGLSVTAATGGTGTITRQWYRSTTSGFTPGAGNILSGATNLTLSETGLTPGTTYYYKVVHTDSVGTTATTAQQTVTTSPALVAGTASASSAGSSSVTLVATAATGGRAPVTVQWYCSTSSGSLGSAISGGTGLTHTDTGRSPSTTYYYTCRHIDADSDTADSNQASATTNPADSFTSLVFLEVAMEYVPPGAVDRIAYFDVQKIDGTGGRIGLTHSDVTLTYVRDGGTPQTVPLSALPSAEAAHADGQFGPTNATLLPGIYRTDLPDAAFATGGRSVTFYLTVPSGAKAGSKHYSIGLVPSNVIQVNGEAAETSSDPMAVNVVEFLGSPVNPDLGLPANVVATYGTALTSPSVPTTGGVEGGSGGLDAAGVRAALGLADANLDAQLSGLATLASSADVVAIKAVTDQVGPLISDGKFTAAALSSTPVSEFPAEAPAGWIGITAFAAGAITPSAFAAAVPATLSGTPSVNVTQVGGVEFTGPYVPSNVLATYGTALTSPSVPTTDGLEGGSGGLDAAGVRAALGLADANLDAQLGGLATVQATLAGSADVVAIKAVTDRIDTTIEADGDTCRFTAHALGHAAGAAFPAVAPENWIQASSFSDGAITVAKVDQAGLPARLAPDGLDTISVADPGPVGEMTTLPKMLVALWRRHYKKTSFDPSGFRTYADDGLAVNTVQTVSDGEVQIMEAAQS
jgi:hypothetical protein